MRPLVVLHVGAPVERLHADFARKPFDADAGGADGGRRGWGFGAQLEKQTHTQTKINKQRVCASR